MDEQIIILPVLPTTFEYQEYSKDDNQLISASILDTVFSSSTDYIEYYAYDENNKFKTGDKVSIIESKPFSKNKKFQVMESVK